MQRPSRISLSLFFLSTAALSACAPPTKPPETPDPPAATTEADPSPPASPEAGADKGAAPSPGAKPPAPDVDKSMSLDTYEMTPADCNALGKQYGLVARNDQMAGLSPKLSEKQRAATAAQIDKVVGKLEDTWTNGCHASLVNKAVDHDAINCALAAKTVKAFDVCINGAAGTPQSAGKKK